MVNPRRSERDAQIALVDEKSRRLVREELRRERVVDQRGQAGRPAMCHDMTGSSRRNIETYRDGLVSATRPAPRGSAAAHAQQKEGAEHEARRQTRTGLVDRETKDQALLFLGSRRRQHPRAVGNPLATQPNRDRSIW
jgi:hypothetical protein